MAGCALRSFVLSSTIPSSFRRCVFRTPTTILNPYIPQTTHLRRYCSHHHHQPLLNPISEVSKTEGRVGQTTNVVDDTTDDWTTLDRKVNSYPTEREFTAIGLGGDDFVQAMVVAVESVLQQKISEGLVKQKISSKGKYVSVTIGPVQVASSEQVQAVYNAMRSDGRRKYSL
ncbi:Phosphoribosylformylglycinamidine synthase [Heracleum sosnowskyi]|uniref:Phosphoribosylformylglycinamidine synthase n=1 Tax=Heracleum sosnowskyi TaxID=360622 RepID=A0AAD8MKF3_9APIA|nr:Phosphoribosylformylglycinamidine synthase [Heracleum sosnowskyi]